jgi:hypothetical protein
MRDGHAHRRIADVTDANDYAERAAALPVVVKLHRVARVLPLIALLLAAAGLVVVAVTQSLWGLSPIVLSPLIIAASNVCRGVATAKERDAIALWVHRDESEADA